MSKRTYTGKIVSDKMQKTVVVAVEMPKRHKIYGKKLKSTQTFMSRNTVDAKKGDFVVIEESKPFSNNCSWVTVSKLTEEVK